MISLKYSGSFDLALTLTPGQSFRWRKDRNGWFRGVLRGRIISILQENNCLYAESNDEKNLEGLLREYLDLDTDYDEIRKQICVDPYMAAASNEMQGLHILRQEPWECLASYILTVNNNIPRIQKMIETVCETYGQKIHWGDLSAYSFPTPQDLSHSCETDLRNLRMGYRAKSLCLAAQKVTAENIRLSDYKKKDYNKVKEFLTEFYGVGEKVADCVALFSLDKMEAFPVDVWIKRVVEQIYFKRETIPIKKVHTFAAEKFGPYAGYAQNYLFYYARNHSI